MSHEIRSEPTPCARPGRHAHRPLCPLGRRCTGCRFAIPPWRNLCCWMAARHPHASRGERCALCSGPISTACPPPPTPAAQPHGLRCEQRLVDGRVIHSRVDGLLPHALVRIILLRGRCGRGLVRRSLLRIRRLLPELSWAVMSWAVLSCRGLSCRGLSCRGLSRAVVGCRGRWPAVVGGGRSCASPAGGRHGGMARRVGEGRAGPMRLTSPSLAPASAGVTCIWTLGTYMAHHPKGSTGGGGAWYVEPGAFGGGQSAAAPRGGGTGVAARRFAHRRPVFHVFEDFGLQFLQSVGLVEVLHRRAAGRAGRGRRDGSPGPNPIHAAGSESVMALTAGCVACTRARSTRSSRCTGARLRPPAPG